MMEVETTKVEKKPDLTPRLIDLVSPIEKDSVQLSSHLLKLVKL